MDTKTINKSFDTVAKSTFDDATLTMSSVIGSTGNLDRHGERVNPLGWNVTNFKLNPVILVNHDDDIAPPAKCTAVRVQNNNLMFDLQFDANDPIGVLFYNKFKNGFLNAFSVGFRVSKFGEAGTDEYDYMEQELLELSIVFVPANPDAVVVRSFYTTNKDLVEAYEAKGFNILTTEQKALLVDKTAEDKSEVEKVLKQLIAGAMADIKTDIKNAVSEALKAEKQAEIEQLKAQSKVDKANEPPLAVVPKVAGSSDLIDLVHTLKHALNNQEKAKKALNNYLATITLKLGNVEKGVQQ